MTRTRIVSTRFDNKQFLGFVKKHPNKMKRQRHEDTTTLPTDAWTVVASFTTVEDILAVLSINRAIREAILDYLVEQEHFQPIHDTICAEDDQDFVQIYIELLRLFAVHMSGIIIYPVANNHYLLEWPLRMNKPPQNMVTLLRLVQMDKRIGDIEYQDFLLKAAAQDNTTEIVRMMLKF